MTLRGGPENGAGGGGAMGGERGGSSVGDGVKYVMAFSTTHKALKAEGVLKNAGVGFRLFTAPKALSEYCSLLISVSPEDLETAKDLLEGEGVRPKAVYRKEGGEYVEV